MTDYSELVKALRHCGKDLMPGERCKDSCPYGDIALCLPKLKLDAADAIEDLQKDLTTLQKCYEIADTTVDKVAKQLPKRGKWLNVTDSYSWYGKCSVCGEEFVVDAYYAGGMNYCPNCGADMRKMEVQE